MDSDKNFYNYRYSFLTKNYFFWKSLDMAEIVYIKWQSIKNEYLKNKKTKEQELIENLLN
jgi:hypothetical protein